MAEEISTGSKELLHSTSWFTMRVNKQTIIIRHIALAQKAQQEKRQESSTPALRALITDTSQRCSLFFL